MDELIKKLKASLAELGSPDSELRRLYKQALADSRAKLAKAVASVDEKTKAEKSALKTAAAVAQKNTGIEAEQSGLIGSGVTDALERAREYKINAELDKLQSQADEQKQLLGEKQRAEEAKQSEELAKAEAKQKAALEKQLAELQKSAQPKEENKYNPTVTAKELAKSILEKYPGDKEKANEIVAGLNEIYNFDDDYLRDLGFAIEAYSIKDTVSDSSGAAVPASRLKELVAKGEEVFKEAHAKIYRTLSARGDSGLSLQKNAIEMAKLSQMDFFYRSSPTKEQFELVCKQAGLSDKEIREYDERVEFINNHTDGRLELGEYLKKEG